MSDTPTINQLAARIKEVSESKGWHITPRDLPERLMMAVTELAEATEELREIDLAGSDLDRNKVARTKQRICALRHAPDGKPCGFTVELADCIIRCMHMLDWLGADTQSLIETKVRYNATRPHKHGKTF